MGIPNTDPPKNTTVFGALQTAHFGPLPWFPEKEKPKPSARYFKSENGSRVKVSGKHMGIYDIEFDWLEEGGCYDAHPEFNGDLNNPEITAYCDCCDPQGVNLKEVTKPEFED